LRHIITGEVPEFSPNRAAMALSVVANDLDRQFGALYEIHRHFESGLNGPAPLIIRRKKDGNLTLIDIHSPVAVTVPIFATQNATIVIDELMVRRHLGEVVEKIYAAMQAP
jgi:hypothetical protein